MSVTDVELDELVTISGGGTPSKSKPEYFTGTIPWVSPKDMKFWEIVSSQDKITEEAVANSTAKLIAPGAVLVVIRSGVLKHSLPVAINRVPVTINQDVKALRCGERILPEYLARYLQANAQSILTNVRGTTADNIPTESLRQLRLPLPPLSEQKRIAEILDRAEALRAKRRAALALLDELTQSIFLDMFGDPVTNPMGWETTLIGKHATKIGSGATPRGGDESYKSEGISLIRSLNVRDGELALRDLAFIDDEQARKLENVIVECGDVLLNITGASVARVCRAPLHILPARVNQHVCIIRTSPTLNSRFLEAQLLTPQSKRKLLGIAEAGATRQAITKSQVEGFQIIMPPREFQDEFDNRMAKLMDVRDSFLRTSRWFDQLFASLQHRAFRGEL